VNVTVFGAAGRTGRHVVERALGHGHAVRAFVHRTPLALEHERLSVVGGDIRDFDDVAAAVESADAVAFALSQGGRGDANIHQAGIENVIHAMAAADVFRLAAVSAAGTFKRGDRNLSLAYRALVATALRSVYDDLEAMEQRIMASALDWTIVRPVGLTDEPATGDYRVSLDGSLLSKSSRISREDVAAFVVKALETDTYVRRAVVIAQ
jgi:putative NADH-flavin reductase